MNDNNNIIRFDWAAKRILRDKANFGVLEGLLTVLIGEQICIQQLLESESNQAYSDEKYYRLDLYATNSQGDNIIIVVDKAGNTKKLVCKI